MKKILHIGLITLLSSIIATAQRDYTAGEIQSKREVKYGRFEMLMYSSDVSGTTSTFFMWKNRGETPTIRWNELDIETFGKSANEWQSNPIWEYTDTDVTTKRWEEIHSDIPIANTWVKFALEWTPNYIAWFNNDIEVRRIVKGENVPAGHFRYNGGNSDDPVGYIADAMRMCFNHWATYPGEWLGPWNPADLPSYQFVDWFTYQPWNGSGFDPIDLQLDFNSAAEITTNFNISTHTFGENQCQFSTKAVGVTNGYLWLGIFGVGNERNPQGNEIPDSPTTSISHIVPGKIEAEEFSEQLGLVSGVTQDLNGGMTLGYTDTGDWAEYTIDVAESSNYTIDFRVASLNGNAGLKLEIDGATVLNDVVIEATGGWENWTTISETIYLTAGKHTLRYEVLRPAFNLNWMELKAADVTANPQAIESKINFYPNPVQNSLHLSTAKTWELYSSFGALVNTGFGDVIDMQSLPNGVYFLKIDNSNYKIIKQ